MGSLVREMQQDALNSAVSVSDLLRKALVVSTKLQVDSEREWIRWELFGYPADDNSLQVESYRVLHGKPEVFNPFRGTCLCTCQPSCRKQLAQSISDSVSRR